MSRLGPPPSFSAEVYREIIGDLTDVWDSFEGAETRTRDIPIARYVFALAANSYRAARAATALWDVDLWHESTPNSRVCFESAVRASWTQQTGRIGLDASDFEQARQTSNLLRSAESAGVPVPVDLRDAIGARRIGSKPAKATEARNFEAMCEELRGGKSLYLMYRHLSDGAHASSAIARHLVPDARGGLAQVKNPAVSEGAKAALGCSTAYALVWAQRAFIEVMLHKPSKQPLRRAAQRLGIPPILAKT